MAYKHTHVKAIELLGESGAKCRVYLSDIRRMVSPPTITGSPDPWKHRSSRMKCATCMWCVEKEVPEGTKRVGRCRRHAPTMNGYPVVFMVDWCGDHKLDENKA